MKEVGGIGVRAFLQKVSFRMGLWFNFWRSFRGEDSCGDLQRIGQGNLVEEIP